MVEEARKKKVVERIKVEKVRKMKMRKERHEEKGKVDASRKHSEGKSQTH